MQLNPGSVAASDATEFANLKAQIQQRLAAAIAEEKAVQASMAYTPLRNGGAPLSTHASSSAAAAWSHVAPAHNSIVVNGDAAVGRAALSAGESLRGGARHRNNVLASFLPPLLPQAPPTQAELVLERLNLQLETIMRESRVAVGAKLAELDAKKRALDRELIVATMRVLNEKIAAARTHRATIEKNAEKEEDLFEKLRSQPHH